MTILAPRCWNAWGLLCVILGLQESRGSLIVEFECINSFGQEFVRWNYGNPPPCAPMSFGHIISYGSNPMSFYVCNMCQTIQLWMIRKTFHKEFTKPTDASGGFMITIIKSLKGWVVFCISTNRLSRPQTNENAKQIQQEKLTRCLTTTTIK